MSRDSEKGRYASPEGSATWEYIATLSCSLLIFCGGCIAGWNSPTLDILMKEDRPNRLTASDASTLTGAVALGHAIAPTFTIVLARRLGRKRSLLASGIPTVISWGLIAISQHIVVLMVARFVSGLAIGLLFCIPQMYLGEIASPKLRGAIGMTCGIMINSGILFMFIIVPFLSVSTMSSITFTFAAIAVVSTWFIPESPYFLATIGRIEEAEAALEKLRGKTDVSEELEVIKMATERSDIDTAKDSTEEKTGKPEKRVGTFKSLFTVAGNRKTLCINLLFASVLQLGSFIIITVYGNIIFDKMNTGVTSHVCNMIIASLQLVSNILTAFIIDKIGRRPLVLISGSISGACVLIIGVYFYLLEYTEVDVTPYATFALCAVFLNTVALNVGLMPLQHVIQSETLATEVKELATCVIIVGGGMMATFGVKSYLTVAETWGFGHSVPFLAFAANTWISTGLILKLLPETKGKTLYEIQRDLNAR